MDSKDDNPSNPQTSGTQAPSGPRPAPRSGANPAGKPPPRRAPGGPAPPPTQQPAPAPETTGLGSLFSTFTAAPAQPAPAQRPQPRAPPQPNAAGQRPSRAPPQPNAAGQRPQPSQTPPPSSSSPPTPVSTSSPIDSQPDTPKDPLDEVVEDQKDQQDDEAPTTTDKPDLLASPNTQLQITLSPTDPQAEQPTGTQNHTQTTTSQPTTHIQPQNAPQPTAEFDIFAEMMNSNPTDKKELENQQDDLLNEIVQNNDQNNSNPTDLSSLVMDEGHFSTQNSPQQKQQDAHTGCQLDSHVSTFHDSALPRQSPPKTDSVQPPIAHAGRPAERIVKLHPDLIDPRHPPPQQQQQQRQQQQQPVQPAAPVQTPSSGFNFLSGAASRFKQAAKTSVNGVAAVTSTVSNTVTNTVTSSVNYATGRTPTATQNQQPFNASQEPNLPPNSQHYSQQPIQPSQPPSQKPSQQQQQPVPVQQQQQQQPPQSAPSHPNFLNNAATKQFSPTTVTTPAPSAPATPGNQTPTLQSPIPSTINTPVPRKPTSFDLDAIPSHHPVIDPTSGLPTPQPTPTEDKPQFTTSLPTKYSSIQRIPLVYTEIQQPNIILMEHLRKMSLQDDFSQILQVYANRKDINSWLNLTFGSGTYMHLAKVYMDAMGANAVIPPTIAVTPRNLGNILRLINKQHKDLVLTKNQTLIRNRETFTKLIKAIEARLLNLAVEFKRFISKNTTSSASVNGSSLNVTSTSNPESLVKIRHLVKTAHDLLHKRDIFFALKYTPEYNHNNKTILRLLTGNSPPAASSNDPVASLKSALTDPEGVQEAVNNINNLKNTLITANNVIVESLKGDLRLFFGSYAQLVTASYCPLYSGLNAPKDPNISAVLQNEKNHNSLVLCVSLTQASLIISLLGLQSFGSWLTSMLTAKRLILSPSLNNLHIHLIYSPTANSWTIDENCFKCDIDLSRSKDSGYLPSSLMTLVLQSVVPQQIKQTMLEAMHPLLGQFWNAYSGNILTLHGQLIGTNSLPCKVFITPLQTPPFDKTKQAWNQFFSPTVISPNVLDINQNNSLTSTVGLSYGIKQYDEMQPDVLAMQARYYINTFMLELYLKSKTTLMKYITIRNQLLHFISIIGHVTHLEQVSKNTFAGQPSLEQQQEILESLVSTFPVDFVVPSLGYPHYQLVNQLFKTVFPSYDKDLVSENGSDLLSIETLRSYVLLISSTYTTLGQSKPLPAQPPKDAQEPHNENSTSMAFEEITSNLTLLRTEYDSLLDNYTHKLDKFKQEEKITRGKTQPDPQLLAQEERLNAQRESIQLQMTEYYQQYQTMTLHTLFQLLNKHEIAIFSFLFGFEVSIEFIHILRSWCEIIDSLSVHSDIVRPQPGSDPGAAPTKRWVFPKVQQPLYSHWFVWLLLSVYHSTHHQLRLKITCDQYKCTIGLQSSLEWGLSFWDQHNYYYNHHDVIYNQYISYSIHRTLIKDMLLSLLKKDTARLPTLIQQSGGPKGPLGHLTTAGVQSFYQAKLREKFQVLDHYYNNNLDTLSLLLLQSSVKLQVSIIGLLQKIDTFIQQSSNFKTDATLTVLNGKGNIINFKHILEAKERLEIRKAVWGLSSLISANSANTIESQTQQNQSTDDWQQQTLGLDLDDKQKGMTLTILNNSTILPSDIFTLPTVPPVRNSGLSTTSSTNSLDSFFADSEQNKLIVPLPSMYVTESTSTSPPVFSSRPNAVTSQQSQYGHGVATNNTASYVNAALVESQDVVRLPTFFEIFIQMDQIQKHDFLHTLRQLQDGQYDSYIKQSKTPQFSLPDAHTDWAQHFQSRNSPQQSQQEQQSLQVTGKFVDFILLQVNTILTLFLAQGHLSQVQYECYSEIYRLREWDSYRIHGGGSETTSTNESSIADRCLCQHCDPYFFHAYSLMSNQTLLSLVKDFSFEKFNSTREEMVEIVKECLHVTCTKHQKDSPCRVCVARKTCRLDVQLALKYRPTLIQQQLDEIEKVNMMNGSFTSPNGTLTTGSPITSLTSPIAGHYSVSTGPLQQSTSSPLNALSLITQPPNSRIFSTVKPSTHILDYILQSKHQSIDELILAAHLEPTVQQRMLHMQKFSLQANNDEVYHCNHLFIEDNTWNTTATIPQIQTAGTTALGAQSNSNIQPLPRDHSGCHEHHHCNNYHIVPSLTIGHNTCYNLETGKLGIDPKQYYSNPLNRYISSVYNKLHLPQIEPTSQLASPRLGANKHPPSSNPAPCDKCDNLNFMSLLQTAESSSNIDKDHRANQITRTNYKLCSCTLPPYDSLFSITFNNTTFSNNLSFSSFFNLLNSHISMDTEFTTSHASFAIDTSQKQVDILYSILDALYPHLIYTYNIAFYGVHLDFMPKVKRQSYLREYFNYINRQSQIDQTVDTDSIDDFLDSPPVQPVQFSGFSQNFNPVTTTAASNIHDVTIGVDHFNINGSLLPFLQFNRYILEYHNYFPKSTIPAELTSLYQYHRLGKGPEYVTTQSNVNSSASDPFALARYSDCLFAEDVLNQTHFHAEYSTVDPDKTVGSAESNSPHENEKDQEAEAEEVLDLDLGSFFDSQTHSGDTEESPLNVNPSLAAHKSVQLKSTTATTRREKSRAAFSPISWTYYTNPNVPERATATGQQYAQQNIDQAQPRSALIYQNELNKLLHETLLSPLGAFKLETQVRISVQKASQREIPAHKQQQQQQQKDSHFSPSMPYSLKNYYSQLHALPFDVTNPEGQRVQQIIAENPTISTLLTMFKIHPSLIQQYFNTFLITIPEPDEYSIFATLECHDRIFLPHNRLNPSPVSQPKVPPPLATLQVRRYPWLAYAYTKNIQLQQHFNQNSSPNTNNPFVNQHGGINIGKNGKITTLYDYDEVEVTVQHVPKDQSANLNTASKKLQSGTTYNNTIDSAIIALHRQDNNVIQSLLNEEQRVLTFEFTVNLHTIFHLNFNFDYVSALLDEAIAILNHK